MTKKEAISIISKCALLYESNLCNKQLAFVYRNCNNLSEFIEVSFRSNNFLHFTGIETVQGTKANAFYRNAIDKRLKESDLVFKNNHTTEMKLQILQTIMKIPYSARMIGDYTGPHLELYTEKITGTTTACLGLIKKDTEYVPNTILKEDIRNLIPNPPGKIFAIFRKQLNQSLYTELTYQSNRPEITKKCLPDNLRQRIDQSLFHF